MGVLQSTTSLPKLPLYPVPHYCYINTIAEANDVLRGIQGPAVIGFDLEAVAVNLPDVPKPRGKADKKKKLAAQIQQRKDGLFELDWKAVTICLVQIATEDGGVFLIHLSAMGDVPLELLRICESPLVLKVTTGIYSDGQRLWDSFRWNLYGAVTLGLMAKLAFPEQIHPKLPYSADPGLTTILPHVLGYSVDKHVQHSDWNVAELSKEQKDYAATDAHAALKAFQQLLVLLAQVQSNGDLVDENWYTFDVVERKRVERNSGTEWKAACPWWSGLASEGFVGRNLN
ncbi:ribonuclease H-like domain-containing protein [Mycena pura]|uniref:Ribonuclease H-like domain-containing protein n=1 Tax=Mycena pura TaxID=153505 RepID=A0AAD6YTK3_9AGAR|nr:ribonuclease H-like domain-containing protein [Mycena pura]